MTGDCHVRFCERLGVKFPLPTRPAFRWAPIDKNRNLTVKKDFGLKNGFSVESVAGLDEMADK